MDRINRYINVHIPLSSCNFRCHYCYVTIHQTFSQKIPELRHDVSYIRKALSRKRLGGICHLNFCANGETLLLPQIIECICELVKEGHYITIVSNCTIKKKIEELANLPDDVKQNIFLKASYHYLELQRTGLTQTFFSNLKKIKDSGISFTVEITPNDELIPHIDQAVSLCVEHLGAAPHFTIARDERKTEYPILTNLSRSKYKEIWGKYNSKLFDFKYQMFGKKITSYCYAGDWFFNLDLISGNISKCYNTPVIQNIYEDINAPIYFSAIGYGCPEGHCYNAHAMVSMGIVPEIDAPTYTELRDRVTEKGETWLTDNIRNAFSQKLYINHGKKIQRKSSAFHLSNFLKKICKIKGA